MNFIGGMNVEKQVYLLASLEKLVQKKVALFDESKMRYLTRALLASLYLGIGVSISAYFADKANHLVDGLGKFAYSFMFSWGLIMIVFLGAELATTNMMYLSVGTHRKVIHWKKALLILCSCILANFVAATVLSYVLSYTATFNHLASDHYLFTSATAKLIKSPLQLFVEGVITNIIVNIAILMQARMKDDSGKIMAVWFVLYIFTFLGFEHVIANFSTFTLSYFVNGGMIEGMSIASVLTNFLFSGLGNFVGGAVCMGLVYSWLNQTKTAYLD